LGEGGGFEPINSPLPLNIVLHTIYTFTINEKQQTSVETQSAQNVFKTPVSTFTDYIKATQNRDFTVSQQTSHFVIFHIFAKY